MVGQQAERRLGREVRQSSVVGRWREFQLEAKIDRNGRRCLPLQVGSQCGTTIVIGERESLASKALRQGSASYDHARGKVQVECGVGAH